MQLIVKTQGFRGLYQGHTLTLARAIPHAAIGYTIYEQTSRILIPTRESQTPFKRFLAGAITGISAMPFTYPFELIRVRMAIEMKSYSQRPSPWNAIRTIWAEGRAHSLLPALHFYRGFTVSALGTVPYRGGIFLIWETLNAQSRERFSRETLDAYQTRIHLVIGAISGTVAQVATYPLEVIRRTQQASGAGFPERMIGFRETVTRIWTLARWGGFFSGLGIGLIKQVPMHSISLVVWQIAKRLLNV
ncbi:hypothetical protein J132_05181 [Termitomyces sp. J132]|nr:hypothetical protein J132_05181 [Termitomyces sp. J132]